MLFIALIVHVLHVTHTPKQVKLSGFQEDCGEPACNPDNPDYPVGQPGAASKDDWAYPKP